MSIPDNRIFVNMFPDILTFMAGFQPHVERVALLFSLKFERYMQKKRSYSWLRFGLFFLGISE